jgi:hypothetical protein
LLIKELTKKIYIHILLNTIVIETFVVFCHVSFIFPSFSSCLHPLCDAILSLIIHTRRFRGPCSFRPPPHGVNSKLGNITPTSYILIVVAVITISVVIIVSASVHSRRSLPVDVSLLLLVGIIIGSTALCWALTTFLDPVHKQ